MPNISTCLWFDTQALDAAEFYVSVFPNASVGTVVRRPPSAPGQTGSILTASFTLDGREFLALNGGPMFRFNEAVSLIVPCDSQAEIDHYWERLTDGGQESMCGWLKDRFGLSWQIVPSLLPALMRSGDAALVERVTAAFMTMRKFDLAALQRAAQG